MFDLRRVDCFRVVSAGTRTIFNIWWKASLKHLILMKLVIAPGISTVYQQLMMIKQTAKVFMLLVQIYGWQNPCLPACDCIICHSCVIPLQYWIRNFSIALPWHHSERDSISNFRRLDYSLNRLFRSRWKKTSKLCVTGLRDRNPLVTDGFPSQTASNAENVFIWWRVHEWRCREWGMVTYIFISDTGWQMIYVTSCDLFWF